MLKRRTPFFQFMTGVLISLCCQGGIPVKSASAKTLEPPPSPPCESLGSYDPGVRPFVEVQCQVNQTIFTGSLAPSTGYRFVNAPSSPGEFAGVDCHGRAVTLEVAQSVQLPLRKRAPQAFTEDDEGYMVIGWLKGDVGRVPVSMYSIKKPSQLAGSNDSQVFAISVLTDAEVERASHNERLLAGARIVDPFTGKSKPISQAPRSMALTAVPSDLSTLYGEEVPATEPHADVDCISIAYKRYAAADEAARKLMAHCMIDMALNFSLCMGACVLTNALIGPLGLAGMAICTGICLANECREMKNCIVAYTVQRDLNLANLQLDLEACGVHTVQT